MLAHDRHHGVVGVPARPVALPFEHHRLPRHRHDAGLDHALHRIVVRLLGRPSGSIGNHVDLVVALEHGRDREGDVAHLRPQARHDDLGAVLVCLERIAHLLVVPRIHRRALEYWLVGKHVEQLGIGVAGEACRLDGGDGGRDLEHLCSLGEGDDVVLQHLAVDRLHAERHLRLLVDKDELRVQRCEDFELRTCHG